ncbi:MAG: hypothetical protein ACE5K8_01460, partial [Candidatus Zixiibacteriota bacterium]
MTFHYNHVNRIPEREGIRSYFFRLCQHAAIKAVFVSHPVFQKIFITLSLSRLPTTSFTLPV